MLEWIKRTLKKMGPGFITGAADDDPAGIATYTQAGVTLGYNALWSALFSIPFMITVQEMCGRIGIVTRRGLAGNIARKFPRWIVFLLVGLLFAANTLNLGADMGMMAASIQLIVPLPFPLLVIGLTTISVFLQIFSSYESYAKYLKWLTISLMAYIGVVFAVGDISWLNALKGTFFPRGILTQDFLMMLVAVLGTSISPYLFFWQTSQEVEEQNKKMCKKILNPNSKQVVNKSVLSRLQFMRNDVGMGMTLSNVVAWFIVLLAASTLRREGFVTITSAAEVAAALEPLAGRFASLVFALATLGTGLLTVPILSASAAYAICEVLHIPEGLSKKWHQAQAFYGLIIASSLLGLMGNFVGINPVRALIYSAIANAIVAPFILVAVVLVASDKKIMGAHVSTKKLKIAGWITVGLMTAAPLLWLYATWKGW